MKFNLFNRVNIMTLVGTVILIGFAVVASNVTIISAQTSKNVEEKEIEVNIDSHKHIIKDLVNHGMDEINGIRDIVLLFHKQGNSNRNLFNNILRAHAQNNQDLLGFWMVWEPDLLDGQDLIHRQGSGSNEVGRFVPYWHWKGDSVILENCINFETSDYYQLPKSTMKPYLLDPYFYKVNNADSLLISIVVPIVNDGQFLGVVGADLSLNKIRKVTNRIAQSEQGEIFLLSSNGTYVAHHDKGKVGTIVRHISAEENGDLNKTIIETIKVTENEKAVRFISSIDFEELSKPWYFVLTIPEHVLIEDFENVRVNILLVTGISALLILFLIIYNEIRWRQDQQEKQMVLEELNKSDARLTSFIESPKSFSIYSLDKNYCYTGFNSAYKREMKEQLDADIEMGQSILRQLPTDRVQNSKKHFRRALDGEQFTVTSILNGEYYNQIFNPVYDQNSQVIGLTSSIINVTSKIRSEQELERYKDHLEELVTERTKELTEQKEFSQKIVDQIPALIFVRDLQGKYQLVNQKMAESVSMDTKELLQKDIQSVHKNPTEAERFLIEDKRIIDTGEIVKEEIAYKWPDGTNRWLFLTKGRLTIGDKQFILGVHFDITDLKETELKLNHTNEELQEALEKLKSAQLRMVESEKMASLGQLTAGLAHEINNPINYVAGNIQPIKRDIKEIIQLIENLSLEKNQIKIDKYRSDLDMVFNEIENLLNGIADGADRVITLMDNLKSFSLPAFEIKGEVELNQCLETTINLIQYQSGSRITYTLDLGDIPLILGSIDQLKQVFLNILTNAIHAIPEEGSIHVSSMVENNEIVILIKDSGTGVSNEAIGRIFDPFFTTKDVGQGTGLGLSISYRIITEHGGHIFVKETSEKGTTFQISFPIESWELPSQT